MLVPRLGVRAAVEAALARAPAVALLGPRQVGKTTLARMLAQASREGIPEPVYLDLERAADLRRLDDPGAYLRARAGRLTIIDEVHRAPGLLAELRGVIDARRAAGERTGQFLLLGSPPRGRAGRGALSNQGRRRRHRARTCGARGRTPLRLRGVPVSIGGAHLHIPILRALSCGLPSEFANGIYARHARNELQAPAKRTRNSACPGQRADFPPPIHSPRPITAVHSAASTMPSVAVTTKSEPASETMVKSWRGRMLTCEPTSASAVP